VNKDILNKYLVNPIKLTTSSNVYIKRIEKEIKREVVMNYVMENYKWRRCS
jgi:hypothetical protein